jgi:hypothetical protein
MMMDRVPTHVTLSGAKGIMPDSGSFATFGMAFPELA